MDTHVGSIIYNISFDLRRDFAPIGLISINPMLLVATKALPADDLKSLVGYMKAHPGDAKFVNQNASAQVGGLLLQKLTGTDVLFVPYRGAGPAMTYLISGQVDLLLVQGAVALPQVRAGTIKALAELSAGSNSVKSISLGRFSRASKSRMAFLYSERVSRCRFGSWPGAWTSACSRRSRRWAERSARPACGA